MLNEDYKDILLDLSDEKARFVIVGAYALAVHGYPRATVDLDIWVMPSKRNAEAVLRALRRFGAPIENLTETDLESGDVVFQIGVAPRRIDILTGVTGLAFEDAFERATKTDMDGIQVSVLCIDDLIRNKRATGRTKDLADAEELERLQSDPP